jgi:hypothetical protein
MSKFLYAAELKKTFRCYGHFYRLSVKGTEPILCRSVLEITSLPREAVGAGTDPDDLFSSPSEKLNLPDAVVIMMNPGSSRPIEEGDTDSLLTMPLPEGYKKPLALTQPDNTQYQLMRIMVAKGWQHIRILNISDIRDPKSPSFIARTKALDGIPGGNLHSLFSKGRSEERKAMLCRKKNAPFILGWGQDAGLIPLAEQCLSCIEGERIATIPSETNPLLTAHPSPMMQDKKEQWIAKILTELN